MLRRQTDLISEKMTNTTGYTARDLWATVIWIILVHNQSRRTVAGSIRIVR